MIPKILPRLHLRPEKGAKEKELPVHLKLEKLLDEYIQVTGLGTEPGSLLSRPQMESPASYPAGRLCARTRQTCLKRRLKQAEPPARD